MITGLDWVNPVLLRDCQQVVRSRVFMWVCTIWLIAQLMIGLAYIAMIDPTDAALSLEGPGTSYFAWLMFGLVAVFMLVLPVSLFNRVVREHREATLELLTISRVSAGQVASGYLLGTLAQMGLYLFLCFPFLVFAYLFRGLELGVVFWSMYFAVLGGIGLNAVSLTIGSFCRTPRSTLVGRLLFGGLMGFLLIPMGVGGFGGLIFELMDSGLSGGSGADMPWEAPAILTLLTVMGVTICFVFARSNLLFEAANRSTLPRATVTACLLLSGLILYGFALAGNLEETLIVAFDVAAFILLCLYGCWILNEPNTITPRMREGFPRTRFLHYLALPFLPGRGTAILYLMLNGVLASGLVMLSAAFVPGFRPDDADWLNWVLLKPFALFIIGVAMLVHHLVRRTRVRGVPFVGWLVIVFCVILWFPLLFGSRAWFAGHGNLFFPDAAGLSSNKWMFSSLWRGAVAPVLGFLCAVPALRENVRNIRTPS